jgi:hypothetical protein
VIVLKHPISGKEITIARADLQAIIDLLPDGALKTMLENFLASLP